MSAKRPDLEIDAFCVRLPQKFGRKLRLLRESYEDFINQKALAVHLEAGKPAAKFLRKRVSLSEIIERAVELFLVNYDEPDPP